MRQVLVWWGITSTFSSHGSQKSVSPTTTWPCSCRIGGRFRSWKSLCFVQRFKDVLSIVTMERLRLHKPNTRNRFERIWGPVLSTASYYPASTVTVCVTCCKLSGSLVVLFYLCSIWFSIVLFVLFHIFCRCKTENWRQRSQLNVN